MAASGYLSKLAEEWASKNRTRWIFSQQATDILGDPRAVVFFRWLHIGKVALMVFVANGSRWVGDAYYEQLIPDLVTFSNALPQASKDKNLLEKIAAEAYSSIEDPEFAF